MYFFFLEKEAKSIGFAFQLTREDSRLKWDPRQEAYMQALKGPFINATSEFYSTPNMRAV
jgi:hypothetical protein